MGFLNFIRLKRESQIIKLLIFYFSDAFVICLVALTFMDVSSGAISIGHCDKAKLGGVYETCRMDCDWDGGCSEEISTEVCDCNGFATFTEYRYNFEVLTTLIYTITLTSNYNMFFNVCF